MKLGIKDASATVFVAAGVLAAYSVVGGWSWPLMNGARMGIVVLGAAGVLACAVSGWGQQVANGKLAFANPFMILGAVLGVVALAVGVIGLFADSTAYLSLMIMAVIGLWLVTTAHRALSGFTGRSISAA